jgi:hypothetical protein
MYLMENKVYRASGIQVNEVDVKIFINDFATSSNHIRVVTTELKDY